MTASRRLPWGAALLAALFLGSGTLHLLRPQVFEGIVPRWLPSPRGLVYLSGTGELACGAGLLHPATRRVAGYASAALLVAVFPANVQMALDAGRDSTAYRVGTWLRLPLQVPLIVVALRAAHDGAAGRDGRKTGQEPRERPDTLTG